MMQMPVCGNYLAWFSRGESSLPPCVHHTRVRPAVRSALVVQVTAEGKYIPPPKDNQKAMYGTMLFVRADIVQHTARFLAKAACIATRYCCVRRQTAPAPSQRELQVRSLYPSLVFLRFITHRLMPPVNLSPHMLMHHA